MRFHYFDREGREVPISSVEALAFRIRTGLVTEETLLYDAAVDRWMPAGEHRIFRFVKEEGEGPWAPEELVAPPASDERGAGGSDPDEEVEVPPTPRMEADPGRSPGAEEHEATGDPDPDPEPPAGEPVLPRSDRGPRRRIALPFFLLLLLAGAAYAAGGADLVGVFGVEASPAAEELAGAGEGISRRLVASRREVAVGALASAVDREFAAEAAELMDALGLGDRAPRAWLQGRYLAGAGRYPEVKEFWERLQAFVASLRSLDEELYRGLVLDRVLASGLDRDAARSASEVVLRRFREGAEIRERRYDALAELAEEAVALHELLAGNEAAIAFEPFWGEALSRDPVVEAVADDPALAEEMWSHLDRIFELLESIDEEGRASTLRLRRALLLEGR